MCKIKRGEHKKIFFYNRENEWKNLLKVCDCSLKHARLEYDIFLLTNFYKLEMKKKHSRTNNLFKISYFSPPTHPLLSYLKKKEKERKQ